jgi:SAM-dependent methyltransferase
VRVARLDLEAPPGEHAHRYDAVILLALVEHLVDPLAGLRHVREMLRPGGIAFIDTPNIAKYSRRAKLLFGASRRPRRATRASPRGRAVRSTCTTRATSTTSPIARSRGLLVERCGFSRTVPAPYVTPPHLFGRRVDAALARWRPQLFAELCLVAYA